MTAKHVLVASELDISHVAKEHRDPFDRLLLSQAKADNYSFLTHDARLPLYNEKCTIMA
jgi:PIN domain nuclease of toxin-antitoxin system